MRLIAEQACVAETTIYRRWGSLTGVVAGAMSQLASSENPIPDNGTLAEDLQQLLQSVVTIIERPSIRRLFRFALSFGDSDESASDVRNAFGRARFPAGTAIIDRAIARGEIPPLRDAQTVIESLVGPAYVRTFLLERPVTEAVLETSVRSAMAIARGNSAASE